MSRQVIVYADAAAVADTTAARFLVAIGDAVATRGRADVVVTGGTVGIAVLEQAASSAVVSTIDWTSVHVWWGDERFVATGDPDRNEGQAQSALLGALPLPEENIHRMGSASEFATAAEAAQAYLDELRTQRVEAFDVLMLGLGPDGHVASLFPGHEVFVNSTADVAEVHDSPKPPPTRVTLGLSLINRAREVWIVAAGDGKAEAVAHGVHGNRDYPGACVSGTERTLWLIDAAAATKI